MTSSLNRLLLVSILSIFSLPTLADCHSSIKQTPDIVAKLENYVVSGSYIKEVEKKILEAKSYLDRRLKNKTNEKFAMVLDIDETAISNLAGLQEHHFSTNMEAFAAHYLYSKLPAVAPVLGLYHYAKRRDVEVFFVTSRPNIPEVISATVRNLKQAGYSDWNELYLKPLDDDSVSSADYKKATRQKIQDKGYTIVLNIGDQETDLRGGIAEVAIKLPNPFYLNSPSPSSLG